MGQRHLPCRFTEGNFARTCTKSRTGDNFYFPFCILIMASYSQEHRPHRQIDIISSSNLHGNTHRRGVGEKWVLRVIRFDDKGGSYRLFTQVFLKNVLLDSIFQSLAKVADDGQINAPIH